MVQRYRGTEVQWYNGTMVQWYNGTRRRGTPLYRCTSEALYLSPLLSYHLLNHRNQLNTAPYICFNIYSVGMVFNCLETDK